MGVVTADQPLSWASSPDVDVDVPSAARLYDFFLGGAYNFAADRDLARRVLEISPDLPHMARENRQFVIRAVQHLAGQGYDQYIDVGCGLPVTGAVHEIARNAIPTARVVYVDNEAVAVAHGEHMLATMDGCAMVNGDVRVPESFLRAPITLDLLDFSRPVVMVLAAVMHFVSDDENPAGIMAELRDALPPGSRLVFSHGTVHDEDGEDWSKLRNLYKQSSNRVTERRRGEIEALLTDFQLLEPLGWVTDIWQDEPLPEGDGPRSHILGCIGAV
ncbi:MAG TPA: SAM-dependent methyltransferase [Pseudonocardiaceae bacterium]|nr:SAM-dependent methyltransferase [Pseudonocardiaceae bacterium]